jgi:hypothetical protein
MEIPRPVVPPPPVPPSPPPDDHPGLTFLGWYPNAPRQSMAYEAGLRTALLLLMQGRHWLSEEGIAEELAHVTGVEADSGSLGRALQRLEGEGLVSASDEEGTRKFRLSAQ